MTHGVPYFMWRDGRCRWHPPAHVREKGFRGRDLKDGNGHWLPIEAALDMARELNAEAGIRPKSGGALDTARLRARKRSKAPPPSRQGYVYFLWAANTVKIGFSVNPFGRADRLRTGLSLPIQLIAAVHGSKADEAFLHYKLRAHRLQGEWFNASRDVIGTMLKIIRVRKIERSKLL